MILEVNSSYAHESGIFVHTLKTEKTTEEVDLGGVKVTVGKVDTYRFITETALDQGQKLDFSKVSYKIVEKEFVNKEDNKPFTVKYITISQAA